MSTTHYAIVAPALGKPLEEVQLPTPSLAPGTVLVSVLYASTTPLDVWQAHHGLLVNKWPITLSDALSGVVTAVHESVSHLKVGDKVFSFTFGSNEQRASQAIALLPANRVGKIPANISPAEVTTVPNNLVTAIHALTTDLKLDLHLTDKEKPVADSLKNKRILIWGGSSSVGQYAIQLLKLAGYNHIITTASSRHHAQLKQLGATTIVDYNSETWKEDIGEQVDLVLDCIGDVEETLKKIAKVVRVAPESRVAALLPLRYGGRKVSKVAMDLDSGILPDQVFYEGVRTHYYEKNDYYKQALQPEIIPELLASGKIKPNKTTLINEGSRLASYQKAIDKLASGEVSGEKLVIQISEDK